MTKFIVIRTGWISSKNVLRETCFCSSESQAKQVEAEWNNQGKRDIETGFKVEVLGTPGKDTLQAIEDINKFDKQHDIYCY